MEKKKLGAVDAHHHLWDLETNHYPWLTPGPEGGPLPDFEKLCRNYLLEDFRNDCANQQIVKSVHVQAEHDEDDPVRETAWLQGLADDPASGGFPHAIVAGANLEGEGVEAVLEAHASFANVRGIRQILNLDPKAETHGRAEDALASRGGLLANEAWLRHFSLLRRYDLSFDLQIFPEQVDDAVKLVASHPDTQIVLNHTLMPFDRSEGGLALWRRGIQKLAGLPNVAIKISGLAMAPGGWNETVNRRLVMETLEVFGTERCLFASNFPVDGLVTEYDTIWNLFREVISPLSEDEQRAVLSANAERVYRI
ncbi:MAG: amidohydrolase family protein [Deltaproteobacteria bacterium]|jgi:predicted TIM-barrel fold metal-dependent hydrolase|nr:amidohydrolase family protein [Deltaproteobacteria bacterium]MBW2495867.1 amidohydrolase family protein [Deltaproteobacteria bacterium]